MSNSVAAVPMATATAPTAGVSTDAESGVTGGGGAFNAGMMLAVVIAGVLAFMGFLVLSAVAPQMDGRSNGGSHALSIAGTGFAAITDLAERAGLGGDVLRAEDKTSYNTLLVITPDQKSSQTEIMDRITAHAGKGKVLIIPEKWLVQRHPSRRGWVQKSLPNIGQYNLPTSELGLTLTYPLRAAKTELPATVDWDDTPFTLSIPTQSFAIEGTGLESVIDHPGGGMLLGYADKYPGVYILSDADLLNNQAMDDPKRAEAALRLLTYILNYDDLDAVQFDVTVNGLGNDDRSLLRMAFTPPFLGITLSLIAAALFAGWQSLVRFGPPWRAARAVALGKTALVTNAAELMRQAGKDHHGAGAYARNIRDTVAMAMSAPAHLKDAALEDWLNRRAPKKASQIGELMRRMERADNNADMLDGARALSRWRKDMLREH
jgi:hypothetical protein